MSTEVKNRQESKSRWMVKPGKLIHPRDESRGDEADEVRLGSGTDVDDNTQISHWFYYWFYYITTFELLSIPVI